MDFTHDTLAQIAKLKASDRTKVLEELGRQEFQRCADDIMYWLDAKQHPIPFVYTQDQKPLYACKACQVDGLSRAYEIDKTYPHMERFHHVELDPEDTAVLSRHFDELPTTRPFTIFEYMPPIIRTWLREKIVLVEKSRDMMATWLVVTMYTWDTLFHKNRQNIFQSEDASKSHDLVKRAYFIWDNQPAFLKNVHKANFSSGSTRSGILTVPTLGCEIFGFPQGADQIRQYHPSGVFTDETAFQTEAEAGFMAIKPAIRAGGRYTGVSTANPSWFDRAVRDALD